MAVLCPNKVLFSLSLLIGVFIAVSSSSWYVCWIGLELNLLSFTPLIVATKNSYCSDSAFKYFLVQAMGSAVLLAGAVVLKMDQDFCEKVILASLLLKMGSAPLHFWVPVVMEGLSWGNCLILMSIQKIAPMVMVLYGISTSSSVLLMGASISSALIGGLGGLNQVMIRSLLAFSSISHTAWMLAAMVFSTKCWIFYISIYIFTTSSLILVLKLTQIYFTVQFAGLIKSPEKMLGMFLTLFSMGGLPPFLGFLPKMLLIEEMSCQSSFVWLFILVMSSLLSLYFYSRLLMMSLSLITPKLSSIPFKFQVGIGIMLFLNLFFIFIPLLY